VVLAAHKYNSTIPRCAADTSMQARRAVAGRYADLRVCDTSIIW
jgi:hypothetical protein